MDEEQNSQIVEKNSSKEKLSEVKEELEIKRVQKEYFIEKVNDYSTLITTKVFGLGSLVIGILELLDPSLLDINLTPPVTPFALISVGMALLINEQVILVIRKALKIFAE